MKTLKGDFRFERRNDVKRGKLIIGIAILLAVVVVFVRDCDAEKNADDERDDNEDHPCKERHPIIERASLQEREHEEQEESKEHHGDTSFLG